MKISRFIAAAVCVAALSAGVSANQAAQAKPDSAAAQVTSAQAHKPALSKQTSVQRTTKKTNWSKIKTLFE
jgi:hypothetical protein